MTDTIEFPLEPATLGRKAVSFTILDTLDALPDGPGLYVLMGSRPGETPRPLAFGHVATSLAKHLSHQPEFAAALREGLGFTAIAAPLAGCDSARLADRLGRLHNAPINTLRNALRDIDAAQMPHGDAVVPLAAE